MYVSLGGLKKGSLQQKMLRIYEQGSDTGYSNCFGMESGKDEAKPKALIIQCVDIKNKTIFLSKRRALKGEKIYLGEDLTSAQVRHHKKTMPRVLATRKEGEWAYYTDVCVTITEKRAA